MISTRHRPRPITNVSSVSSVPLCRLTMVQADAEGICFRGYRRKIHHDTAIFILGSPHWGVQCSFRHGTVLAIAVLL